MIKRKVQHQIDKEAGNRGENGENSEISVNSQASPTLQGSSDAPQSTDQFDQQAQSDMNQPGAEPTTRTVKGARLISKTQESDGTFTELWAYNTKEDFHQTEQIRQNILQGTDILSHIMQSEDGSQTCSMWSCGNLEMIQIKGLPE